MVACIVHKLGIAFHFVTCANLFALAARRRKRTIPSLPRASTVPGRQSRTRFLTTNYQQASSCRHARENLFLRLRPRAARKSNLNRSSFCSGRDAEFVPAVEKPHGRADDNEKTNG